MKQEKTIVAFHIGRGGRFNNQGHVRYIGEMNIEHFVRRGNHIFFHNRDERGRFCKPYYADLNGNHLIFEEEAATGVGVLNFDNDYDTVYCKHIEDCSERELQLITESIDYKSPEVQEFLKQVEL
jgi:hypothetical protein